MSGLPDYLGQGLKVLFVGYNPGEKSALCGHHYAGRGNQFWRLLYDAGLTGRLYSPEEDSFLPSLGYGLTNLVSRPSKSSTDLRAGEKWEGAQELRRKVAFCRPGVVCFLGKEVYRCYSEKKSGEKVLYGLVPGEGLCPGSREFVAPNPSGRSTIPYAEKLLYFGMLKDISSKLFHKAPAGDPAVNRVRIAKGEG